MLCRIVILCLLCSSLVGAESIYLKTPQLTRADMVGVNVGIRPYRKTGVRLETEWFQDKLVIHNYGYGGSGLTLAFGGSQEVLDLLQGQQIDAQPIAVIGAGVVGLAVAYDLLEKGYEVHLYADQWSPQLTSDVAAGLWTPLTLPLEMPLEKQQLHQRMLETAENRIKRSLEPNPEFEGIRTLCCYFTSQEGVDAVELLFDNGVIKKARVFNRLALDGKIFMQDLFSKVKAKGARLEHKRFEHVDDVLALQESIIINCTSMGSYALFNDHELYPVRGHMIYFPPQDLDYILAQHIPGTNYVFFVFPWSDRTILGGVYELGEGALEVRPEVVDNLLHNAEKYFSGDL